MATFNTNLYPLGVHRLKGVTPGSMPVERMNQKASVADQISST